MKFHGPTAFSDWFQHRVFADAVGAAEKQRVVEFLPRTLYPVRKPLDDMLDIIGIDFLDVIEPRPGRIRVAGRKWWADDKG